MSIQKIEKLFPNIVNSGYSITSSATAEYNCIAWAARDTKAIWWPDPANIYYWPRGITRKATIEAFIELFESLGYSVYKNGAYEKGFEKIAIYFDENKAPTHAARQLNTGLWTSKLGDLEDIEHVALDQLLGSDYGVKTVVMRRAKKQ